MLCDEEVELLKEISRIDLEIQRLKIKRIDFENALFIYRYNKGEREGI